VFSHGRDNRGTKRNVIDEVAVHDVEMKPIRAGLCGAMDLGLELRKIRGEDGRSDEDFLKRHKSKSWKKRETSNVQRPTSNVQLKRGNGVME
jgi:hypothetical protein